MNKIKAIIFDMDGVIVDSEPVHFEAHQKSLREFGMDLSLEEYLKFGVATGDKFLYENIAKKYPGKPISVKDIHIRKKEIYKELTKTKLELREGILKLLSDLSAKYRLAIASSGEKEIVMFVLEKFKIADYFEVIVTGGDIERVKPFPDVYLKAIEKLDLQKDECVAIEDSETGLRAAVSAGIICIAVPCTFTESQDFTGADVKVNLEILRETIDLIK